MMPGDSPAGARRRVRLAIRRHREAMGRTQQQVADDLSWSVSKVNRIENGDNTISKTDLTALLQLLEVRDEREVARLLADAGSARAKNWWNKPEYRGHLTRSTRDLFELESEASAIRSFQTVVFPGLLQTRDYAASAIGGISDMPEETRSVRLEVRMLRQENFRENVQRPHHIVILDEFVLQRIMGSRAIVADQLKCVADAIREGGVSVRLLPREEPNYLRLGAFVIYDIKDEANAFLYREGLKTDRIDQDLDTVSAFRTHFDNMWDRCLKEEATLAAVDAQYALIRAELERYP